MLDMLVGSLVEKHGKKKSRAILNIRAGSLKVTPLHLAAKAEDPVPRKRMIELLITKGNADPSVRDGEGHDVVGSAASYYSLSTGQVEELRTLIREVRIRRRENEAGVSLM